ncbi:MAG: hypothetical protein ACFE9R_18410 [Candidatus Hermodarchaeota archaeon]
MFRINETELVLFSIYNQKNIPIGKTELIKSIFLFSNLANIEQPFQFSSDLYGPNEEDGCISAEIDRHSFIISDYKFNKNVYYFREEFFNKYKSKFEDLISINPYLGLLNNITYFMRGGSLPIKIALIYSLYPEFTEDSIIKDNLKPFVENKYLLNKNIHYLLNIIPSSIFGDIFSNNLQRFKPFICLSPSNSEILMNITSILNEYNEVQTAFPLLNKLIGNVVDYNYKYLLEYISFVITKNINIINNDLEIKKMILINLLKFDIETRRDNIHKLMSRLQKSNFSYSILT